MDDIFSLLDWFGMQFCRYGVMLEHFQKQDPSIMERIKGCIVDSAPVAYPDPEVMTIALVGLGELLWICVLSCSVSYLMLML